MKAKLLFVFVLSILFLSTAQSQDYKTSLGIRVSPYYGLTFKHFFKSDRAMEFILLTRKGGYSLTGLYEIHTPAFSSERLKAYGGFGGHAAVFQSNSREFWVWNNEDSNFEGLILNDNNRMVIGVDLIIGLEYTIKDLPFAISLDWKPGLNLIGGYGISTNQLALSLRFTF